MGRIADLAQKAKEENYDHSYSGESRIRKIARQGGVVKSDRAFMEAMEPEKTAGFFQPYDASLPAQGQKDHLIGQISKGETYFSNVESELKELADRYASDPSAENALAYNRYLNGVLREQQTYNELIEQYSRYFQDDRSAEDIAAEIADIDSQIEAMKSDDRYTAYMTEGNKYATPFMRLLYANETKDPEYQKYVEEWQRLQRLRSYRQQEHDQAEYSEFVSEIMSRPDFEENSVYVSKKNEDITPKWTDIVLDTDQFYEAGYEDLLYEAVNGDENARMALIDKSRNSGEPLVDLAKSISEGNQEVAYMTEDEVAIFNYIYATEGQEAAHEFYYKIKSSHLDTLRRIDTEDYMRQLGQDKPFWSSVGTVLSAPMKVLTTAQQVGDYIADGELEKDAAYNAFSYAPQAVRQQVSMDIERNWGPVGSFAYNIGMSTAEFLFTNVVTGGQSAFTLTIMGSGAMADTVLMAKDRGLSDHQAMGLGIIAGMAEAFTERYSIEAWLDGVWEKNALQYILKNALTEGSEEGVSSLINLFADILIAKDKSEWEQSISEYKHVYGMSEGKAFMNAFWDQVKQIGLDVLAGMASGALLASSRVAVGKIGQAISHDQTAVDTKPVSVQGEYVQPDHVSVQDESVTVDPVAPTEATTVSKLQDHHRATVEDDHTGFDRLPFDVPYDQVADKRSRPMPAIYGLNGMKAFSEALDSSDMTAEQMRMEFQPAYEAGMANLPKEMANLRTLTQKIAYNAGAMDALLAAKDDHKKAGNVTTSRKPGFDTNDMSTDNLPNGVASAKLPADVTKAQVKAIDTMAKATGVRVRMVRGLKGNAQINGNEVLIDISFQRKVGEADRSIVFYAAHEIGVHRLMKLAPTEGRAFINAVIREANAGHNSTDVTVTQAKQDAYAEQDVHLSTEEAMEENAADSILGLYENEEEFAAAIERIVNGKDEAAKKGARTFKEILTDILKSLKDALAKVFGKERAEIKQAINEVENLRDMFEKAFTAATERAKGLENRNSVEYNVTTETQHSAKDGDKNADRGSDQEASSSGNQRWMAQDAGRDRPPRGRNVEGGISLNDTQRREIGEVVALAMDKTARGREMLNQNGIWNVAENILSVINLSNEYDKLLTMLYPGLTHADIDNIREISKHRRKLIAKPELTAEDKAYFAALKFDKSKAEKMVGEAAERAGYNLLQFHFTGAEFTVFKFGEMGFHVGTLAQANYIGKVKTARY